MRTSIMFSVACAALVQVAVPGIAEAHVWASFKPSTSSGPANLDPGSLTLGANDITLAPYFADGNALWYLCLLKSGHVAASASSFGGYPLTCYEGQDLHHSGSWTQQKSGSNNVNAAGVISDAFGDWGAWADISSFYTANALSTEDNGWQEGWGLTTDTSYCLGGACNDVGSFAAYHISTVGGTGAAFATAVTGGLGSQGTGCSGGDGTSGPEQYQWNDGTNKNSFAAYNTTSGCYSEQVTVDQGQGTTWALDYVGNVWAVPYSGTATNWGGTGSSPPYSLCSGLSADSFVQIAVKDAVMYALGSSGKVYFFNTAAVYGTESTCWQQVGTATFPTGGVKSIATDNSTGHYKGDPGYALWASDGSQTIWVACNSGPCSAPVMY